MNLSGGPLKAKKKNARSPKPKEGKNDLGKGVSATPPGILQPPAHWLAASPSHIQSEVFEQTHNPWPHSNAWSC